MTPRFVPSPLSDAPLAHSEYGEPITLGLLIMGGIAIAGEGTAVGLRYAANRKLSNAQNSLDYKRKQLGKEAEQTNAYLAEVKAVSDAEESVHDAGQTSKLIRAGALVVGIIAAGWFYKNYEPGEDTDDEASDEE